MRKRRGGFEIFSMDDYEITEEGEVINIRWGRRRVKPQPNGKGYLRVQIAGKMYFVHRLVAEKYIPNPNQFPQVNHIDGNKLNNRVSNLEWVSNDRNRKHAVEKGLQIHGEKCPWAKLSVEDVKFIREHPEIHRDTLAKKFGVAQRTISDVVNRKTWKDV